MTKNLNKPGTDGTYLNIIKPYVTISQQTFTTTSKRIKCLRINLTKEMKACIFKTIRH